MFAPRRSAAVALILLGTWGCTPDSSTTLWTTLPSAQTTAFAAAMTAYNRTHPSTQVKWENVAAPDVASRLEAAAARKALPELVLVPAAVARALPAKFANGFTSDLSPKIAGSFIRGFAEPLALGTESLMPVALDGEMLFYSADDLTPTVGAMPTTLKQFKETATTFKKKTGFPLFMPAFADGRQLLRFAVAQNAHVANERKEPVFVPGELHDAVAFWVDGFQSGVFPKEGLDLTEEQAIQALINHKCAVAMGGRDALLQLDRRPDKTHRFTFFRPFVGMNDTQWAEPIGLVHPVSGGVSMAGQNLISYLTDLPAQSMIAAGYGAVPVVEKARSAFPGSDAPANPAMAGYLGWQAAFLKDGVPMMPMSPKRDRLALELRQAVVDTLSGKPIDQALTEAAARFAK